MELHAIGQRDKWNFCKRHPHLSKHSIYVLFRGELEFQVLSGHQIPWIFTFYILQAKFQVLSGLQNTLDLYFLHSPTEISRSQFGMCVFFPPGDNNYSSPLVDLPTTLLLRTSPPPLQFFLLSLQLILPSLCSSFAHCLPFEERKRRTKLLPPPHPARSPLTG